MLSISHGQTDTPYSFRLAILFRSLPVLWVLSHHASVRLELGANLFQESVAAPQLFIHPLISTPPPPLRGLEGKTADFATHRPSKSPSMARCYASRTQDCELEIVSPLSPPGRSLELGETVERYKSQWRGKAPLTPDGLPDSYPFPWQKISFCYCWLGRSTEECTRIYCPMHHWPNCLRNPSSRTFHRWL